MVEKTRRSVSVLRRCQESDREELNYWRRRSSEQEDPRKGGSSSAPFSKIHSPHSAESGGYPLCASIFDLLFVALAPVRRKKTITPPPSLQVAPIVSHEGRLPPPPRPTQPTISPTTLLTLMYTGWKPNQQKFVIMGFFPRRRIKPSYERNGTDSTLIPSCGFAASFFPTFKVTAS